MNPIGRRILALPGKVRHPSLVGRLQCAPMQDALSPADFAFDLPDELIAQTPLPDRVASRLLHVPAGGDLQELCFAEVARLLRPDDLLILNDTRVIPGRLYGRKETGGQVEMLLERMLDEHRALVQLRSSKSPRAGARLIFEPAIGATVTGRQGAFFELLFDEPLQAALEAHGHVPLPP